METTTNNFALNFARQLEANKQKQKQILQEKMQTEEYKAIFERLKSRRSDTV